MARNPDRLWRDLTRQLAIAGPASAADLAQALGISQPSFSRIVGAHRGELLVVGRARSTRYALRRAIPEVGTNVLVYEVDEKGASRKLARLHVLEAGKFYVEALTADIDSGLHDDLPYFLHDMRPAGFLGRIVPKQHPELDNPGDVSLWSADQTLRYLVRFGSHLPGSLIVGDEAFARHMGSLGSAPITRAARPRRYEQLAERVLEGAPPGSSAAGEQPKFLTRRLPGPREVLVKFSAPLSDATSRRLGDLLVAEHVAHRVLPRHGQQAAASELVEGATRLFLEVERFDRTAEGGRRGVISLLALDAEFVGSLRRWSETGDRLAAAGHIDADAARRLRWLEAFGRLIANTDMHFGNASFYTRGTRVLGLTPAYDMSPMLYAPGGGHLSTRTFSAPTPDADAGPYWQEVCDAAEDFWTEVAAHALVSKDFRRIAKVNAATVARAREAARRLPRSEGERRSTR